MSNDLPVAFMTLGRTAAGKTTLAKALCSNFGITLIPEAAIKRKMVDNYQLNDSLREDLRDKAYMQAIELSALLLEYGNPILLDAAFHKQNRREWFFEKVKRNCSAIILFYCRCPDIEKVKIRLQKRKALPKNAETQADDMKIYNFIDSTFDEPILKVDMKIPSCIISINTSENIIENIHRINFSDKADSMLYAYTLFLEEYLNQYKRTK